ncbi:MAG: C_GCAxxG_C_C family protein [Desulfobacterales bacterium]|nr:C_GCAxxG_C_C family protein [Desulfobacterales bacterium]MCP4162786.1 C_GCAxxG_C_C family protein [Deltaproteobacteria bacterium]
MNEIISLSQKRSEKIRSIFSMGYTCSESIILSYADTVGFDRDTALKMSCGLSGGLAQGKTCGAVVAAFMIISYKYSSGEPEDIFSRDLIYQIIQEFTHQFVVKNNSIECKEILLNNSIDFTNPDEMKNLREKGVCGLIIENAAELLGEILEQEF